MNCEKCKTNSIFEEDAICSGKCAVVGCVRGIARIVVQPDELTTINPGEILITYMTTPDSVGAMLKAEAVITDRGGILCHAAIVCRENNKPCVVGAKDCMTRIKDRDRIIVCATRGMIFYDRQ